MAVTRTAITAQGQRYVDVPQYRQYRPQKAASAVAAAFGRSVEPFSQFTHYERTLLRWMVPDGKGGVRPK